MEKIKVVFVAAMSTLLSCLGILAVPVLILSGLNVTDSNFAHR